jgi:hypothetical protein
MVSKSVTTNSLLEEKRGAKGGNIKPISIRLKPHKVIKVAKGTINKLAKTVMGEKILK